MELIMNLQYQPSGGEVNQTSAVGNEAGLQNPNTGEKPNP
jgi:hypothetical protein